MWSRFVCLALAAVLAACGGGSGPGALDAETADALAGRAETLSDALDAEQPCDAQRAVQQMRSEARDARDADEISESAWREIQAVLEELANPGACDPAEDDDEDDAEDEDDEDEPDEDDDDEDEPDEDDDDEDEEKDDEPGKGKGRDNGKDD